MEKKTIGFAKLPVSSSPISRANVLLMILVGVVIVIGIVWYLLTRGKQLRIGFTRHVDEEIAIDGRNETKMDDNQATAGFLRKRVYYMKRLSAYIMNIK